jgi:hypothetical protein
MVEVEEPPIAPKRLSDITSDRRMDQHHQRVLQPVQKPSYFDNNGQDGSRENKAIIIGNELENLDPVSFFIIL